MSLPLTISRPDHNGMRQVHLGDTLIGRVKSDRTRHRWRIYSQYGELRTARTMTDAAEALRRYHLGIGL